MCYLVRSLILQVCPKVLLREIFGSRWIQVTAGLVTVQAVGPTWVKFKDQRAPRVSKVLKASKAWLVPQVRKDRREIKAPKVKLALQEPMAHKVSKDHKVNKVLQDQRVPKEILVQPVHRA